MYRIVYHPLVISDDIPKLGATARQRIKAGIEQRLASQPDLFGKPLRRSLGGYRKLRVGDYRIVFKVDGQSVKILIIGHRSVVYNKVMKRL